LLLALLEEVARAKVLASPCFIKEQEERDKSSLVYRDPNTTPL